MAVQARRSACGATVDESSLPPPQPANAASAPKAIRHESFSFIIDEPACDLRSRCTGSSNAAARCTY